MALVYRAMVRVTDLHQPMQAAERQVILIYGVTGRLLPMQLRFQQDLIHVRLQMPMDVLPMVAWWLPNHRCY
jgi:hypothetical protein